MQVDRWIETSPTNHCEIEGREHDAIGEVGKTHADGRAFAQGVAHQAENLAEFCAHLKIPLRSLNLCGEAQQIKESGHTVLLIILEMYWLLHNPLNAIPGGCYSQAWS